MYLWAWFAQNKFCVTSTGQLTYFKGVKGTKHIAFMVC